MSSLSAKLHSKKTFVILNTVGAALGLFFFAFGVYLTIQADIGASPWDVLNIGLSKTLNISYGTASVGVSVIILLIDIMLKGKIGLGMFLDAFIVGKSVDLFQKLDIVRKMQGNISGIILLIIGLIVEGFSQYLYMRTALGCGPRDTLLVELKRHMPKVPIGIISICIMGLATLAGGCLGGDVGIGTVLCAVMAGPIMQYDFKAVGFKAEDVIHQDFITSLMIVSGRD